jgi:uncharacterized FlaG/YvyC family protein
MTIGTLQNASGGETSGAQRPAAPNGDARKLSQGVEEQAPEVKAQGDLLSPAQPPEFALAYHVDEKTRQIYFQIVDSQSGQVIRQVPPAEEIALEGRIAQLMEAAANAKQPKSQGGGD